MSAIVAACELWESGMGYKAYSYKFHMGRENVYTACASGVVPAYGAYARRLPLI